MQRYKDMIGDEEAKVGDIPKWLGKYDWYQIGTENINGVEVPIVESKNTGRYYYFNGEKVPFTSKNEIKKRVEQHNANEAANKEKEEQEKVDEMREQAMGEIAENKEKFKSDREKAEAGVKSATQDYNKAKDTVWGSDVWGEGAPTISGFTQIAMDSANRYAEEQARKQAQESAAMNAEAAKQQGMQAAMNNGMSPAQAAAMAGGNTISAYNNAYNQQYNNSFQNQQNQYLGQRAQGLQTAQNQQNMAAQQQGFYQGNVNTANANLANQDARFDNYLGVAQGERDYQNQKNQQHLQQQQQYLQNQLNMAQMILGTITGTAENAAKIAAAVPTGGASAAAGAAAEAAAGA